jgi:hypothetical protein
MPTNLALDDQLIEEARSIGGHKTKKEAVTVALQEYIARRKQLGILELFGTVDYDPEYDYKAERKRARPGGDHLPRLGRPTRSNSENAINRGSTST